MQQFAVDLDRRNHARQHVVAAEQAADFGLDARPGAGGKLAQQSPIKPRMQAEPFGDGENHLPVHDGERDLFGHVDGRQQGPFLLTGGASATLLAGKGHEPLVAAIGAADAGETLMQVAALEEGRHAALDDRPPDPVLGLKPTIVDLLKGGEMPVHDAPQVGGPRIAGPIERQRLDTRGHDRQDSKPGIVYTIPLEQIRTSCQSCRASVQPLASAAVTPQNTAPARAADVENLFMHAARPRSDQARAAFQADAANPAATAWW